MRNTNAVVSKHLRECMFEGLTHIRMNFKGRGHFINNTNPDVKS
jgi:hypothetical protein